MALTKADIAEDLFENQGLNKIDAKDLVEDFFEKVRETFQRLVSKTTPLISSKTKLFEPNRVHFHKHYVL